MGSHRALVPSPEAHGVIRGDTPARPRRASPGARRHRTCSATLASMNRSLCGTFLTFALGACALLAPFDASAWGPRGHQLVASLANDALTPQAYREVERLLADDPAQDLAGIASWADELREHDPDLGKRSARWHYVNIAERNCQYDAARDCPDGDCVIEAIRTQAAILADRGQSLATRRQALKFVLHFIGDIHQPAHAGYAHDRGGNKFQINLYGKGSNLHQLWDSGLLNTRGLDTARYLERLRKLPTPAVSAPSPSSGQALAFADSAGEWAEHSCSIVLQPGFYPPQAKIGGDYVQVWRPVAEAQLRLAGSNLAAVLNQALGEP
ncbi:MAG: S1/P1 nuclease [Lysobacter sp.]